MIRSAMKSAGFITLPDKPAKQQALKCIKQLSKVIPIAKCQMKVRASIPSKELSRYIDELHTHDIFSAQMAGGGESTFVTLLINPESFRFLEELTVGFSKIGLEILERKVVGEPPLLTRGAVETSAAVAPVARPSPRPEGNFICKSCNCGFVTRDEHRAHFKSVWHRYNLKGTQRSLPALSEKEFLTLPEAEVQSLLDCRD